MSGIFGNNAEKYWAVGLPAIPLVKDEKRPAIDSWQRFSHTGLTQADKDYFLSKHSYGNMGLVLGEESGLVMVDIDTTDARLQQVIRACMPKSPWNRVGLKGSMGAYKWTEDVAKTFRIKDADGHMLVEVLSTRTQCVLPPSIHPDTKLPYVSDTNLFDPIVQATLTELPPGIEGILRGALESAGVSLSLAGHTRVTDYVSKGSRDVKMISIAGMYASAILKGDVSFKTAIGHIAVWHATRVEQVAGDPLDLEKGIRRMADFLIHDVTGVKKKALPPGWDNGLSEEERVGYGFGVFADLHVAWDFAKLKNYIQQAFIVHDAGTNGRREAVNFLLERMGRSPLDPLDEASLFSYIVQAGQMGVNRTHLEKQLKALRSSGISGESQKEIAEAAIEDLEKDGPVKYAGESFWQWSGSHWELLNENKVLNLIIENYGHLPMARRASDHRGVMRVMAVKQSMELREADEPGINFANGYLTTDLVLKDHHPSYGCIYTLPYCYRTEEQREPMPMFDEFMSDCWGDDEDYEDKKLALQEALAVTMFGLAPRYERAFCLHGPPRSGKSQMLKIIQSLLPKDVWCAIGPEYWGDKFLPAQLFGKLLNVCGELSERKMIEGQKFKEVVSGEQITGQHKNGHPFTFKAQCAHWFATNHIPRTEDTSQAFNRRWLLITYNKVVSDDKKRLDLGTIIAAAEREAIASWAVSAIIRIDRVREFTLPSSHVERIAEIAKANNSLRTFLLDSGKILCGASVLNTQSPISEIDLFNAYYTFALVAGVAKPVSLSGFRQKMRELGLEMGFRIRVIPLANGGQDCVYENITVVASNVVSLRKSGGTR